MAPIIMSRNALIQRLPRERRCQACPTRMSTSFWRKKRGGTDNDQLHSILHWTQYKESLVAYLLVNQWKIFNLKGALNFQVRVALPTIIGYVVH